MYPEDAEGSDRRRASREFWRSRLKELIGMDDTSGIEILATIRALTRLCEFVEGQRSGGLELSGPRWGLLLALMAHEQNGRMQGLTPSALSRHQGVTRNTISSLLRGLEEQGYIERALDAEDHRVFRIRLTAAGRKVVQSLAPERVAFMNQLAAGLSSEEKEQLIELLQKLRESIVAHAGLHSGPCHEGS